MNGTTSTEDATPSWLVPLYPFTLKLVLDGTGHNATLNRTTLHDLTNGFLSEQLLAQYPTSFYTLRLAAFGSSNNNEDEDADLMMTSSCAEDEEVHEHHSIIQQCLQTQSSGYALFRSNNNNYSNNSTTTAGAIVIPTREKLGELELDVFVRNVTLKNQYEDLLANESNDAVLQSVSHVIFTLDGYNPTSASTSNSGETKSINSNTKLGGDSGDTSMDAISIAAMIAAGAVIVLVLALCYAWRRKAQLDKLRLESIDARIHSNHRGNRGNHPPDLDHHFGGQAPPSTIPSDAENSDDLDDERSDIIGPAFSNDDSQSAMMMMMSMSEIGNDYSTVGGGEAGTITGAGSSVAHRQRPGSDDDGDTNGDRSSSHHPPHHYLCSNGNDVASIVSMDSYAFSIGEMESASRSFAMRQTPSGATMMVHDNDTFDNDQHTLAENSTAVSWGGGGYPSNVNVNRDACSPNHI
uniref:Uncharacterized protein n=1 Tax=Leptocylindrus danicus TaxID=163516 RepID=A0A7S2LAS4_9STRA